MKERWSSAYKLGVGYYLMDIATACGMLEWDHAKDHNKKPSIIYAERLVKQLNEYADSLIGDAHSVYPLIDYPLDWVPERHQQDVTTAVGITYQSCVDCIQCAEATTQILALVLKQLIY